MKELPPSYEPKTVEKKTYHFWKESGFFHADPHSQKPPFCIVIPPPNVTGRLHMGHALVDTLQDILIRWKRMSGFEALWIPGTDHAGISTQTVVERHLMKTTHKTRRDFSREEFLKHVWQWKEESEQAILSQLEQLGCSCDWSRLRFTMDEGCNLAVRTMFKKMYDDGYIYRGDYLVNWDPVTQTALADDEVEYEEIDSSLWYLRYPLERGEGVIVVATTRPETMLGDTAVAVSPKDERYAKFVGKFIDHPITGRKIPIITDHIVDPSFGTGAVKITPAHDHNDYQMALRHHLPLINIMTPDGKINEEGKPFSGLSMEEARKDVVNRLHTLGLIEKIEPYPLRVGVSYRSKAIIEPYLSKQWFVRMTPFKEKLIQAVKEKKVALIPPHWENTYFHWIENLRDWCISRQLWWGHRIPIWYNRQDTERMICYAGEGLPPEVQKSPDNWYQDEDVLDTWFSSALWPFSTMGWPHKTPELKKFYPTSTLITGHDILFFWVARMIFMGEYAMGQVPFHETFLHGLIYGKSYWRVQKDGSIHYLAQEERISYELGTPIPKGVHSKWEKMSKSKGNIIDPLEMIDQFGTDAVRMALTFSVTMARQIDLDRRRFEEFKNFANKIWNGARFVFMNLDLPAETFSEGIDLKKLSLEDRWILSLMYRTIQEVIDALTAYQFDKAAAKSYDFFWKEFCAYYVEISKPILFGKSGTLQDKEQKQKILAIVLCNAIRLMHPMAPFITEELFSLLKERFGNSPVNEKADPLTKEVIAALKKPACIVSLFPTVREDRIDESAENIFSNMDEVLRVIRNIRAEMQLPPQFSSDLFVVGDLDDPYLKMIKDHQTILTALVKIGKIVFTSSKPEEKFSSSAPLKNLNLFIPLSQELREREKQRIAKELEKKTLQIDGAKRQLTNPDFIAKAPSSLVEKMKKEFDQHLEELARLKQKFEELDD